MFSRKAKEPERPSLLDRIVKSGSQRVAILGLHPSAGTRTVLSALVRELHRREWPFALTSAPRLHLDAGHATESVTRLAVPEGAHLATSEGSVGSGDAGLDLVEATRFETALGRVGIYRVTRGGEVDLVAPADAEETRILLERLGSVSGGMTFVDGTWERRAFAAPGATDGLILSVGAALAPGAERAAGAARYRVETLSVPACGEAARVAWQNTAMEGAAALLDTEGRPCGVLPHGIEDPMPVLQPESGAPIGTVVLPFGLNDEFLVPLVRAEYRGTVVVRDATRINLSPVYLKAWLKAGGRIEVVHPVRLVAATTNPSNPVGPDADPAEFHRAVALALPHLPVHDVVAETGGEPKRPVWKFWE